MDPSQVLGEDGFIDYSKIFSNHLPEQPQDDGSWLNEYSGGKYYDRRTVDPNQLARSAAARRAAEVDFRIAPTIMDAEQNIRTLGNVNESSILPKEVAAKKAEYSGGLGDFATNVAGEIAGYKITGGEGDNTPLSEEALDEMVKADLELHKRANPDQEIDAVAYKDELKSQLLAKEFVRHIDRDRGDIDLFYRDDQNFRAIITSLSSSQREKFFDAVMDMAPKESLSRSWMGEHVEAAVRGTAGVAADLASIPWRIKTGLVDAHRERREGYIPETPIERKNNEDTMFAEYLEQRALKQKHWSQKYVTEPLLEMVPSMLVGGGAAGAAGARAATKTAQAAVKARAGYEASKAALKSGMAKASQNANLQKIMRFGGAANPKQAENLTKLTRRLNEAQVVSAKAAEKLANIHKVSKRAQLKTGIAFWGAAEYPSVVDELKEYGYGDAEATMLAVPTAMAIGAVEYAQVDWLKKQFGKPVSNSLIGNIESSSKSLKAMMAKRFAKTLPVAALRETGEEIIQAEIPVVAKRLFDVMGANPDVPDMSPELIPELTDRAIDAFKHSIGPMMLIAAPGSYSRVSADKKAIEKMRDYMGSFEDVGASMANDLIDEMSEDQEGLVKLIEFAYSDMAGGYAEFFSESARAVDGFGLEGIEQIDPKEIMFILGSKAKSAFQNVLESKIEYFGDEIERLNAEGAVSQAHKLMLKRNDFLKAIEAAKEKSAMAHVYERANRQEMWEAFQPIAQAFEETYEADPEFADEVAEWLFAGGASLSRNAFKNFILDKGTYGTDLKPNPDTPKGQLIQKLADIMGVDPDGKAPETLWDLGAKNKKQRVLMYDTLLEGLDRYFDKQMANEEVAGIATALAGAREGGAIPGIQNEAREYDPKAGDQIVEEQLSEEPVDAGPILEGKDLERYAEVVDSFIQRGDISGPAAEHVQDVVLKALDGDQDAQQEMADIVDAASRGRMIDYEQEQWIPDPVQLKDADELFAKYEQLQRAGFDENMGAFGDDTISAFGIDPSVARRTAAELVTRQERGEQVTPDLIKEVLYEQANGESLYYTKDGKLGGPSQTAQQLKEAGAEQVDGALINWLRKDEERLSAEAIEREVVEYQQRLEELLDTAGQFVSEDAGSVEEVARQLEEAGMGHIGDEIIETMDRIDELRGRNEEVVRKSQEPEVVPEPEPALEGPRPTGEVADGLHPDPGPDSLYDPILGKTVDVEEAQPERGDQSVVTSEDLYESPQPKKNVLTRDQAVEKINVAAVRTYRQMEQAEGDEKVALQKKFKTQIKNKLKDLKRAGRTEEVEYWKKVRDGEIDPISQPFKSLSVTSAKAGEKYVFDTDNLNAVHNEKEMRDLFKSLGVKPSEYDDYVRKMGPSLGISFAPKAGEDSGESYEIEEAPQTEEVVEAQPESQEQEAPKETSIEEFAKDGDHYYHVTFTDFIEGIKTSGIKPNMRSNWAVEATGEQYGAGEVFAFESIEDAIRWASKMEWENYSKWNTGNISIARIKKDGQWSEDTNDPLGRVGQAGRWLKSTEAVPAGSFIDSIVHEVSHKSWLASKTNRPLVDPKKGDKKIPEGYEDFADLVGKDGWKIDLDNKDVKSIRKGVLTEDGKVTYRIEKRNEFVRGRNGKKVGAIQFVLYKGKEKLFQSYKPSEAVEVAENWINDKWDVQTYDIDEAPVKKITSISPPTFSGGIARNAPRNLRKVRSITIVNKTGEEKEASIYTGLNTRGEEMFYIYLDEDKPRKPSSSLKSSYAEVRTMMGDLLKAGWGVTEASPEKIHETNKILAFTSGDQEKRFYEMLKTMGWPKVLENRLGHILRNVSGNADVSMAIVVAMNDYYHRSGETGNAEKMHLIQEWFDTAFMFHQHADGDEHLGRVDFYPISMEHAFDWEREIAAVERRDEDVELHFREGELEEYVASDGSNIADAVSKAIKLAYEMKAIIESEYSDDVIDNAIDELVDSGILKLNENEELVFVEGSSVSEKYGDTDELVAQINDDFGEMWSGLSNDMKREKARTIVDMMAVQMEANGLEVDWSHIDYSPVELWDPENDAKSDELFGDSDGFPAGIGTIKFAKGERVRSVDVMFYPTDTGLELFVADGSSNEMSAIFTPPELWAVTKGPAWEEGRFGVAIGIEPDELAGATYEERRGMYRKHHRKIIEAVIDAGYEGLIPGRVKVAYPDLFEQIQEGEPREMTEDDLETIMDGLDQKVIESVISSAAQTAAEEFDASDTADLDLSESDARYYAEQTILDEYGTIDSFKERLDLGNSDLVEHVINHIADSVAWRYRSHVEGVIAENMEDDVDGFELFNFYRVKGIKQRAFGFKPRQDIDRWPHSPNVSEHVKKLDLEAALDAPNTSRDVSGLADYIKELIPSIKDITELPNGIGYEGTFPNGQKFRLLFKEYIPIPMDEIPTGPYAPAVKSPIGGLHDSNYIAKDGTHYIFISDEGMFIGLESVLIHEFLHAVQFSGSLSEEMQTEWLDLARDAGYVYADRHDSVETGRVEGPVELLTEEILKRLSDEQLQAEIDNPLTSLIRSVANDIARALRRLLVKIGLAPRDAKFYVDMWMDGLMLSKTVSKAGESVHDLRPKAPSRMTVERGTYPRVGSRARRVSHIIDNLAAHLIRNTTVDQIDNDPRPRVLINTLVKLLPKKVDKLGASWTEVTNHMRGNTEKRVFFPNYGVDDSLESPYEVLVEMFRLNVENQEKSVPTDLVEFNMNLSKLARLIVEEFYKKDITLREYGDFAEVESLEYGVDFLWEENEEFEDLVRFINRVNESINETMEEVGQKRIPFTGSKARLSLPSEEDIDEDYSEDEVFNVKDMFPYPYSPRSSYDPEYEIFSLATTKRDANRKGALIEADIEDQSRSWARGFVQTPDHMVGPNGKPNEEFRNLFRMWKSEVSKLRSAMSSKDVDAVVEAAIEITKINRTAFDKDIVSHNENLAFLDSAGYYLYSVTKDMNILDRFSDRIKEMDELETVEEGLPEEARLSDFKTSDPQDTSMYNTRASNWHRIPKTEREHDPKELEKIAPGTKYIGVDPYTEAYIYQTSKGEIFYVKYVKFIPWSGGAQGYSEEDTQGANAFFESTGVSPIMGVHVSFRSTDNTKRQVILISDAGNALSRKHDGGTMLEEVIHFAQMTGRFSPEITEFLEARYVNAGDDTGTRIEKVAKGLALEITKVRNTNDPDSRSFLKKLFDMVATKFNDFLMSFGLKPYTVSHVVDMWFNGLIMSRKPNYGFSSRHIQPLTKPKRKKASSTGAAFAALDAKNSPGMHNDTYQGIPRSYEEGLNEWNDRMQSKGLKGRFKARRKAMFKRRHKESKPTDALFGIGSTVRALLNKLLSVPMAGADKRAAFLRLKEKHMGFINLQHRLVKQNIGRLEDLKKKMGFDTLPKPVKEAMFNHLKGIDSTAELNAAFRVSNLSTEKKSKLHSLLYDYRADLEMARMHIDSLSNSLIEAKILDEVLEIKINENLGVYVARAYRLFETEDWDMFLKYTDEGQELISAAAVRAKLDDKNRKIDQGYYNALKALLRKNPDNMTPDQMRMFTMYLEYLQELEKQFEDGIHDYLIHQTGSKEAAEKQLVIEFAKAIIRDSGLIDQINSNAEKATISKEEARNQVQQRLNDLKDQGDGGGARVDAGLTQFLQRKDIDGAFRKLYGEIRDPEKAYTVTINRMAQAIAAWQLHDAIVNNPVFAEDIAENSSQLHSRQLLGKGYGDLNGKWVTEELYQAMQDSVGPQVGFANIVHNGGFIGHVMHFVASMSNLSRASKTILSPKTASRNTSEAMLHAYVNGWLNYKNLRIALATSKWMNDPTNAKASKRAILAGLNPGLFVLSKALRMTDENMSQLVDEELGDLLTLEGVLANDDWRVWEEQVQELSDDSFINLVTARDDHDLIIDPADRRNSFRRFFNKINSSMANNKSVKQAADRYRIPDDVVKIMGFLTERDKIVQSMKADGISDNEIANRKKEINEKAIDTVLRLTPTVTRIPALVKGLSRIPLVGNFPVWYAGFMRSSWNQWAVSLEEITSNNSVMRKSGIRRLINTAFAQVALHAIAGSVWSWLGYDDEEEEAMKSFLPEWQRDHTVVPVHIGEEVYIWDITQSVPWAMVFDIPKAGIAEMKRRGVAAGIGKSVMVASEGFLDEDIFMSKVFDIAIRGGKDPEGRKVWDSLDPLYQKALKSAGHVTFGSPLAKGRGPLTPGVYAELVRTYEAITGAETSSGIKRAKFGQASRWFLGTEIVQLLPKKQLIDKAMEFRDLKSGYTDAVRKAGFKASAAEFEDKLNDFRKENIMLYNDMSSAVRVAEALGMSRSEIFRILSKYNVPKVDIQAWFAGRVRPFTASDKTMRGIIESPEGREKIKLLRGNRGEGQR